MKIINCILCLGIAMTQTVGAASSPDKALAGAYGPVKTITTTVEYTQIDSLDLFLPAKEFENVFADYQYCGNTPTFKLSFNPDGMFSQGVLANKETGVSKEEWTENLSGEFGDSFGTDTITKVVEFYRDKSGRVRMLDCFIDDGVLPEECSYNVSYGFGNIPNSIAYHEASDAHADFNATYSLVQAYIEESTELAEYEVFQPELMKTMVVGQHRGGQDLMPLAVSIVEYSDYKFDERGNWIYRMAEAETFQTDSPYSDYVPSLYAEDDPDEEVEFKEVVVESISASWTEHRTITYYD